MSDAEDEQLTFEDAFESAEDEFSAPAYEDSPPPAAAPLAAPPTTAAATAATPALPSDPIEGGAEQGDSAAVTVIRAVAAGAGAVGRRLVGGGASDQQQCAEGDGVITTSELPSLEGDAQPWMLVELKQNDAQAQLSAKWATKNQAFHGLDTWERQRCAEHKQTSTQQARVLEMLQRQSAAGRDEQLECMSFLQTRAAADTAYANSITKAKLGGRPVSELSDLRGALSAAKAEQGAAADGRGARGADGGGAELIDASGVVAVSSVMSVLGCMMLQAGQRLHKFAESDSLHKDLAASHAAYAAAVHELVGEMASGVVAELRKLDRACADAFGAHRAAFDELQRREVGELAQRDLWLTEFAYRSAVLAYGERVWQSAAAVRDVLERFRAAEHRRVATLHGALRVFVSLQQRLWADISASTTAVHGIFKDLPAGAATGLSDAPASAALERLTATVAHAQYAKRRAAPPSLLVMCEGRLTHQRSLLRTWVGAYAVLTRDLFLHCFNCAPADEPHSSRLRADQLLFSVRCAAGKGHAVAGDEQQHGFEVLTHPSGGGLLGKVGLGTAGTPMFFRAESAEALLGWLAALMSSAAPLPPTPAAAIAGE